MKFHAMPAKDAKRAVGDMCIKIDEIIDGARHWEIEEDMAKTFIKAKTDLNLAFRHLSLLAQQIESRKDLDFNN